MSNKTKRSLDPSKIAMKASEKAGNSIQSDPNRILKKSYAAIVGSMIKSAVKHAVQSLKEAFDHREEELLDRIKNQEKQINEKSKEIETLSATNSQSVENRHTATFAQILQGKTKEEQALSIYHPPMVGSGAMHR